MEILALNDAHFCSSLKCESVWYNFNVDGNGVSYKEIKSIGLLVYSGTGSTSAIKSIKSISKEDFD